MPDLTPSEAATQQPKRGFGCGSPPAVPKPCARCGKVCTGIRKGLCNNCYSRALYHRRQAEKPKKKPKIPRGLTEFEAYAWRHSGTSTIGEICKRMGCTPDDVRNAMDAGILALHGMKRREG